jgi:hypothetical protein
VIAASLNFVWASFARFADWAVFGEALFESVLFHTGCARRIKAACCLLGPFLFW